MVVHISHQRYVVTQSLQRERQCVNHLDGLHIAAKESMFIIAVFHPNPCSAVMRALPPAYNLSRDTLVEMLPRMAGLPVTHEHLSIHNAVSRLSTTLAPAAVVRAMADVGGDTFGRVIAAFEGADGHFRVQMHVPLEHSPNLRWLLADKVLGSVSLTHVVDKGVAVPLEMSLVNKPARPGSVIEHVHTSAIESAKYKGLLVMGGTLRTMNAEVAPPKTAGNVADVIAALGPAERQLIVAKLEALVKHRDEAVEREAAAKVAAHTAEVALSAKTTAEGADKALMAEQMRLLYANMSRLAGPNIDLLEHYCLDQNDVATDTQKLLDANGSHRVLQTIMCCNQAMMMNNMATAAATSPLAVANKRMRSIPEDTPVTLPAPAASFIEPETATSLLARALADSFET